MKGEIKDLCNLLIAHAASSGPEKGLCYIDVVAQYLYPSGAAGVYIGAVTIPVRCSDRFPDNWILPSSGILKYGFGQMETCIKANFNLISRSTASESFVALNSFDKKISHHGQNLTLTTGNILLGEMRGFGNERAAVTISYIFAKSPWGL